MNANGGNESVHIAIVTEIVTITILRHKIFKTHENFSYNAAKGVRIKKRNLKPTKL